MRIGCRGASAGSRLAHAASLAADLASGCCADLEERVAELEATTARKGNRNVSLQVYGQVNRALLIWNDGFNKDAYVVDNDTSSTRLGLIGEARIKPGWLAGYRVEIEFKDAASDEVSNGNDEGRTTDEIRIRHSYLYIDSDKLGRISIGQQSPATDDITIINLGAQMSDAALHYNNNFGLRLNLAFGLTTDLTWARFRASASTRCAAISCATIRRRFTGLSLSAAVGENDDMGRGAALSGRIGTPSGLRRASAIWTPAEYFSERRARLGFVRCTCRRDFICPWPAAFATTNPASSAMETMRASISPSSA